ncbi:death domain-containing protein 1 [Plectropomus leopardus]|uniref:death domain-containing protein 1 n=1 Tax=Plectropomus leopardus TaxID=160734 RepID=UPI001C4C6CB7|nr:death domain-containing protein 1 [Plectropomus leopardus]
MSDRRIEESDGTSGGQHSVFLWIFYSVAPLLSLPATPPAVPLHSMDADLKRSEQRLLNVLADTIRGLEAVRSSRNHHTGTVGGRCTEEEPGRGGGGGEEMLSPAGDEEDGAERGRRADEEREEREWKQRVVGVLRELSVCHADRVTAWRAVLTECANMLFKCPPGGTDQQHQTKTDTECKVKLCSDSFSETFRSVAEDVENIIDKLNALRAKLDKEICNLCAEEASTEETALQEIQRDPKTAEQPEDDNTKSDPERKRDAEDGDDIVHIMPSEDNEQTADSRISSSDCNHVEDTRIELAVKIQGIENEECVSSESQTDFLEDTEKCTKGVNDKGKEETNKEWIIVRPTGQQEDSQSDAPCFIRAPAGVAEILRCEAADTLSCLMVSGSEELVSRVIRVKVQDGANVRFPVTVAVPFCARYRGNYRDVAVKIVDGERRASYVTPVTTEGTYGGQRGSFAEVRVYSVGLFAVVSCLKKENYTVPTKGLSLKLHMDPRICLSYLPGCFTAPVMAQTMVQPVDAVLLAAVKSRGDSYHSVVSTSPLLYLTHPSSQPLRRPLTLTLPCPPNPEKKRRAKEQGEEDDNRTRPESASPPWEQHASHRRRFLGVSVKSKEMSNELLIVLGSRDKQWSVLEKVTVRNQQNGLVSFELTENFDRLLVVRLLSPLQPCRLSCLAEELEEAVCCHAVTVALQRRRDAPHAVLVAALPSRDLSWELSKLRAQGFSGLSETSSEISMCEGDQLLLHFSGNITSTGSKNDQNEIPHERLTFHSQQKNQLLVRLTEVDPFGNYSSPHYKGTAMFYKVTRGQLAWRGDRALLTDTKLLGEPVCKLSLTLPKKVRTINRPMTARVKLCEGTDSLSDSLLLWLSGELSEEEVALLVLSLRLRRSAAQLVKLRAGDSLSTQAFQVLSMWRRGLPAAPHTPKASQLAHCLVKSGRPDLARELLLRQAATTTQGSLK